MLIHLQEYDQFTDLGYFPRDRVLDPLLRAARQFSEADEMEGLLQTPLVEPNQTPHGPAELADILTLHLSHRGKRGVAAFVLKGRSFSTVRPSDISHQVFKLRKIADLTFCLLGHAGTLLDTAKDEFIHTALDLGLDYTIIDPVDFGRLAVVGGLLCPRDGETLKDGQCDCGYRFGGDRLNVLQEQAIRRLTTAHELGQRAGVVIMPTGSGKTRIAALDSRRFGAKSVLYIAHTHEILDSAAKEFEHVFGKDAVVRQQYGVGSDQATVRLSTIQSTYDEMEAIEPSGHDYVVIDEFHHAAARSYRRLIEHLNPAFLLGLTATPFRADRQDVIDLCDGNIIVEFELRTGIDTGILVPYHYYGCFDNVDYSAIPHHTTGYTVKDLNKTLVIPERDQAIIRKWQELSHQLPTLAFCCSREHARRMALSFREAGIPASEYLGSTDFDVRADLVHQLQYGDLKVLCAVDVLNEGVDLPFVECLLFLRPTDSKRIFFQQLGRGLRRNPGKQRAVVLDFIGNFHNAYRVAEYLGLAPEEHASVLNISGVHKAKDVLNLPIGCDVSFDDRVIDVFARQVMDPRHITRHNIAQILIYLYRKTSKRLGRPATKKDIDFGQLLHSEFYALVFGSWHKFQQLMADENFNRQ